MNMICFYAHVVNKKHLCFQFRSAVSSENTMPISYNKETSSKLEKHAEDILTDMNFEIIKDSNTIFPPRSDLKTEIHDCMYCILYSLVSLS